MSEKIRAQHLQRKAILYVRQSSALQVSRNTESQKLQYAMQERLRSLGWSEIEVVDEDLGRSASGTVTRAGFERMVAEVCLGKVGAVAAREVSRFARNSREWQQLVEVCRVVDTVLVDQETVYAPRQSNDRLLLGLKGSLNEYELDLLRQRSVEAHREKARRGELIVASPAGYLKTDEQRLEKDPDRRVQEAVLLLFEKFLELSTVRQTLLWFLEHGLQLPVRSGRGDLSWKRPSYGLVYRMLTNPVYAGTYAYGKTELRTQYDSGEPRRGFRRKPRDQWLALIPGTHEGYVSWEQFERIQRTISENLRGVENTGAAGSGAALVAGVLRCRRCGHKLTVRYTGNRHDVLRYACRGWLDNGEPRCIAFGGLLVDEAIGRELLRVVQPAAIEAARLAREEQARQQDDVLAALERDLEAARYAARRCQKQYDAADPENRLVADELQRRWNQALQRVAELEGRIGQHQQERDDTAVPAPQAFDGLADQLQAVWNHPDADARLKKRILRTLIREIVADIDPQAGEVILVVHWKGGVHTELRVPRRRRGQSSAPASQETVAAVRMLACVGSDDLIAGVLSRNGVLTGRGNRWTRERVTALRSHHHIACYSTERRSKEGWMNLTEACKLLGISAQTLRLAVERGEISAQHPFADCPWIFNRKDLETETARRLVLRARRSSQDPATLAAERQALLFSMT